ncbi:hypothetical protein BGZ99_000098 [Dissophora globulifera]|uniref:Uncharacterized protein n=1 Tax=Dissophora globulifera TaxID=979702 RepID=A0A9P6RWU2_9FUNG|nr:hypothetical protein BGZ99_000098 [Dissophora globulifera]
MLLAIPCSPGHQIQPPVEPGSFLGVRRPLLTQQYAVYDVPFYGIESGDNDNDNEGSSSRYDVAIVSHIPTDEERVEHGLEVTSEHVVSLSEHREHIWSIAHEHEYGAQTHGIEKDNSSSDSSISGGGKSNEQDLNQGRHKRLRRWIPVQPRMVAYSGSGSGCGCSSLYGGSGSRSGHCLRGQSSCSSTSGMCNRAVARATGVTGHTVDITIETAQNSRTQKQQKPASQGKYGPDSFLESLENSKRVNSPPPRGWSRYRVIVRKQWRNWWCLLVTVAVVVVVAVVILLKKPAQANNRSVAVASDDGVEDEQDDNPR